MPTPGLTPNPESSAESSSEQTAATRSCLHTQWQSISCCLTARLLCTRHTCNPVPTWLDIQFPHSCRIVKRADGSDWELGVGNFGKVLRGMRGEVQPVAVKSMFRRDRAMEEAFIREIAMMKCVPGRAWLEMGIKDGTGACYDGTAC